MSCCCLLFLDLEGKRRLVRLACCDQHWRQAETAAEPDQVKAAHP